MLSGTTDDVKCCLVSRAVTEPAATNLGDHRCCGIEQPAMPHPCQNVKLLLTGLCGCGRQELENKLLKALLGSVATVVTILLAAWRFLK